MRRPLRHARQVYRVVSEEAFLRDPTLDLRRDPDEATSEAPLDGTDREPRTGAERPARRRREAAVARLAPSRARLPQAAKGERLRAGGRGASRARLPQAAMGERVRAGRTGASRTVIPVLLLAASVAAIAVVSAELASRAARGPLRSSPRRGVSRMLRPRNHRVDATRTKQPSRLRLTHRRGTLADRPRRLPVPDSVVVPAAPPIARRLAGAREFGFER